MLRIVIEAPLPDEAEEADAEVLVEHIKNLALTRNMGNPFTTGDLRVYGKIDSWELR